MADSDIIVSLHLVIPFISMKKTNLKNVTEKLMRYLIRHKTQNSLFELKLD